MVTTLGSLGDLFPSMPVAEELQRRGHEVVFAAPPVLQVEIEKQGFKCTRLPPLTIPESALSGRTGDLDGQTFRELAGPHFEMVIDLLSDACAGVDAILTTPHQLASAIVGEWRHIPWITLSVFPGFIPSAYTVPQPHWLPALPTPAGRAINRLTWRAYRMAMWHLNPGYVDHALESRGLPVDRELFAPGGISPKLTLVLSSAAYTPPLPDWPATIKMTGFTPWDRTGFYTEPPELSRFLEGGPPPVVVTVSSARNAGLLLTIAKRALEESGRRGILLTGQASKELLGDAPFAILDSGIAAFRFVPFSYLLPRSELVVHHAGIGTVLTTVLHGLPCVAIPTSFDHWYNATRVRALGIGRVIPGELEFKGGEMRYRHVSARSLADEINRVATDPAYRERTVALKTAMDLEDGPRRACDEIEAHIRQSPRREQALSD